MKSYSKSIANDLVLETCRPKLNYRRAWLLMGAAFGQFMLSSLSSAEACSDGCSLFNTYQGTDALSGGVTSGNRDSAFGYYALSNNTTGTDNTAIGGDALYANQDGGANTAIGSQVLWHSVYSISDSGESNTGIGAYTLHHSTEGERSTGCGAYALYADTFVGWNTLNTASGAYALLHTGHSLNTAIGEEALYANESDSNTATGASALYASAFGYSDTAAGAFALQSETGYSSYSNVAVGYSALLNLTNGKSNIAIGESAGALTSGDNNINLGNKGVASDSNTIRIGTKGTHTKTIIAGIRGATVAGGLGVLIDSNGKLGTTTSSARFKEHIQPMDKASEVLLSLQPVTFHYKRELDSSGLPQFGLVAEQVEKVNPDLVARDDEGKPYTVRYDAVNVMLLNEFLKQHRKVENRSSEIADLEATVALQDSTDTQQQTINFNQQNEIEALKAALKEQATQIRKASDQLTLGKAAPRVVSNR